MTNRVVEVNDEGSLYLPPDVLEHAPPHTRYVVNVRSDAIVSKQTERQAPFSATASPQERADDLVRWASGHEDGVGLPDDVLRREHFHV